MGVNKKSLLEKIEKVNLNQIPREKEWGSERGKEKERLIGRKKEIEKENKLNNHAKVKMQ